jgi:UDP-N-acetylmuramate dehydrogenase
MNRDEHSAALSRLAGDLEVTLGPGAVQANQSLTRYTALRIGGPAEILVVADSAEAVRKAVTLAWEYQIPCRVLGGGSNVLISDGGMDGLVVVNRARGVAFPASLEQTTQTKGLSVKAESGASLSTVARQCVARGLAGLEWAANIPGTVGGAVVGNAGAWGGDVASTLMQALVLGPDGVVEVWPAERFEYGYRTSRLKYARQAPKHVVLEAEFALRRGDREALEARVAGIVERRKATQPPGASCGSVFKNPPGDYAGRLVEASGLKGRRVGGAEISNVHANFIVNQGGATAADVKALIDLAHESVKEAFGVELELEIELLGEW